MSENEIHDGNVVLLTRIRIGGQFLGLVACLSIIWFLTNDANRQPGQNERTWISEIVGSIVAGLMIFLSFLVAKKTVSKARRRWLARTTADSEPDFAEVFQQKTGIGGGVIACALIFNVLMLDPPPSVWFWGIAGVLLGILALHFPTQGRYDAWKQVQQEWIGSGGESQSGPKSLESKTGEQKNL